MRMIFNILEIAFVIGAWFAIANGNVALFFGLGVIPFVLSYLKNKVCV